MANLVIATYNTWKCDGEYLLRLDAMAKGLLSINADVLMLQEVFVETRGAWHTADFLADALGMHWCYLPAREKKRKVSGVLSQSQSGLAILSRYPILSQGGMELSTHPEDGDRKVLWAEIHVSRTLLLIANTHLTHLKQADEIRQIQTQEIARQLSQNHCGKEIILGGDFNAQPKSPALAWLEDTKGGGAVNAAADSGAKFKNTLIENNTLTCVDHLYRLSDGIRWHKYRVGLNKKNPQGIYPSDHAAVIAELELDA